KCSQAKKLKANIYPAGSRQRGQSRRDRHNVKRCITHVFGRDLDTLAFKIQAQFLNGPVLVENADRNPDGSELRAQLRDDLGGSQRMTMDVEEEIVLDGYRIDTENLLPLFRNRALQCCRRRNDSSLQFTEKITRRWQHLSIELSARRRRQFLHDIQ